MLQPHFEMSSPERLNNGDEEEGPIQSAVSNALVLRQIFIHLSTRQLLFSCGLVNKIWNLQARTLVRDHRECRLELNFTDSTSRCDACTTLMKLDDSLSKMNVIPMNQISILMIPFGPNNRGCTVMEEKDKKVYQKSTKTIIKWENLARMKIKCFNIHIDDMRFSCPAQYFVVQVLREQCFNLENLTIKAISPVIEELTCDWSPVLPKLVAFEAGMVPQEARKYKAFYWKIIKGAPNLKHVSSMPKKSSWEIHSIFPDDNFLRLLSKFELDIDTRDRNLQCLKIGEIGPNLSRLQVHDPDPRFYDTLFLVLPQLLRSSQLSLKELYFLDVVDIHDIFTDLTWPTLKSLQYIKFQASENFRAPRLLNTIVNLIDYARIFPALERVEIQTVSPKKLFLYYDEDDDSEDYDDDDDDAFDSEHEDNNDDGRDSGNDDVMPLLNSSCVTVSQLELSVLKLSNVDLPQLSAVFPSLKCLRLGKLSIKNWLPLSQVFSLWPELEEIDLWGDSYVVLPNQDAEFCGINPEEVKTLYEKDDDFLKAVNIVPIRPCISTLKRLKFVGIYTYTRQWHVQSDVDPSLRFLSDVTRYLVCERMPQTEVARYADLLPKLTAVNSKQYFFNA